MKKKNEFERKFLLTGLPIESDLIPFKVDHITQIYLEDGKRFRSIYDSINSTFTNELVKKEKQQSGHNIEVIFEPTQTYTVKDAIDFKLPFIRKIRRTYNYEGHILEVDSFIGFKLVVLEVEKETKKELDSLLLPKLFKKYVIVEVTDFEEFSNKHLAEININL